MCICTHKIRGNCERANLCRFLIHGWVVLRRSENSPNSALSENVIANCIESLIIAIDFAPAQRRQQQKRFVWIALSGLNDFSNLIIIIAIFFLLLLMLLLHALFSWRWTLWMIKWNDDTLCDECCCSFGIDCNGFEKKTHTIR